LIKQNAELISLIPAYSPDDVIEQRSVAMETWPVLAAKSQADLDLRCDILRLESEASSNVKSHVNIVTRLSANIVDDPVTSR
jgi:hypothetical protein